VWAQFEIVANHLVFDCVSHIYEKWVQGEKCPFKTLLPYHACVKIFEKEKSNWPFEGTLGKLLTTFYFKVMIYKTVRRHIPSLHFECIKHDLDIYKISTLFFTMKFIQFCQC
jgi:hypothetical protein